MLGNYLRAILDLIVLVTYTKNQLPVDIVAIPEQPDCAESPVGARVTGCIVAKCDLLEFLDKHDYIPLMIDKMAVLWSLVAIPSCERAPEIAAAR